MTSRGERALLVATPFAAMTAVGIGLRAGASDAIVAATVFSAPASQAGLGLAWQVVAFEVNRGGREPLVRRSLDVTARANSVSVKWSGSTNEDGVAEMRLPLADAEIVALEIRSGNDILASGEARVPPRLERPAIAPVWMPFARRDGPILMDVAVLGQRVAPGFPASIWVRATDAATQARIPDVTLTAEPDGSLTFGRGGRTQADGWAEMTATAAGFAISLGLHARSPDGRTGEWHGGLFSSPGAAKLETKRRWAPHEAPTIGLVAPTARTSEYFEIDDAYGRVWAETVPLVRADDDTAGATVNALPLPSGLYWAVVANDASGGALLGPGTATLPFFVAETDDLALRFATDRAACNDAPALAAHALGPCLALAAATPTARWTALDGFSAKNAKLQRKRLRGMTIAWASVLMAMALEALLLIRAATRGRQKRQPIDPSEDSEDELVMAPRFQGAVAVLVALLGLALVAAFVLRWA
jgi:hypothetical protein